MTRLIARAAFGLALASMLLPAFSAGKAAAHQAAPWCAYLSGGWGVDCSYFTFEQCREFISGVGGYCSLNPHIVFVEQRPGYGKRRGSPRVW